MSHAVAALSEPEWAASAAMDWADQKNFWRLLPAGSRQAEDGELDSTPEAVEVWAANLRQRFGGQPIAVILEQTRGPLVYMLTKYPAPGIVPGPPTTAARYRETFAPSGAKSDRRQAEQSRRPGSHSQLGCTRPCCCRGRQRICRRSLCGRRAERNHAQYRPAPGIHRT